MAKAIVKRIRKNYGKIKAPVEMPDLLEVQKQSYREFLYGPDGDPNGGRLARLFADIFPIRDAGGAAELEFLGLEYGAPRFDEEECRRRDLTYAAPLRVHLQLKVFERGERSRTRTVREVRKQVVYFGEIPMMTERGSFIINGTERVIVSQLHRSPGVFFSHDGGKTHASGKLLFNARVIPYRGAWLDFEFDGRDRLFFRIDMRRKLPVGVLLKAFGLSTQEILDRFYARRRYRFNDKGEVELYFDPELFEGARAPADIRVQGRRIVAEGKRITKAAVKRLVDAGVEWIKVPDAAVVGEYAAEPIVVEGGEILVDVNEEITEERLDALRAAGVNEFACLFIDPYKRGPWLADTLKLDQVQSREEAQVEIYRMMRPGEPPTVEAARNLFEGMFFDPARYDLSEVGRMKLNARLGISEDEAPLSLRTLRVEDVLRTIDTLLGLRDGIGEVDDIDHLGNRRVRCVGEQLENQLRTGLVRVERTVRERIATSELESVSPSDLINSKPVIAAIREFFGSNQLSQFMDQTNPLSEITHKRRVSALGPGGLSRERAGFEVRDVHPTHYGRLCPIETPEGQNIGLINSLATYARINRFGFIETPYRKVVDGRVTDEVVYLSALEEEKYTIAQANAELDEEGRFVRELVQCRKAGQFVMAPPSEIELMDVSPTQVVSVSAGLIPFLEHDDANRALMGSNMQRQAVPLVRQEKPLVGTGLEAIVGRDSGACVIARRSGVVERVDSERIVVRVDESEQQEGEPGVDIYRLYKNRRSNQNTCFNQRPLVHAGDRVERGDVLADGPNTDEGELALGRNVLVAFMPWRGYNFEDAIVISERLVRDDVYTSVHIEEYECVARETKLGPEEITRDVPNVREEALRHLDASGIAYIGAKVKAGDILVGKVTPKGETTLTPEEKLLHAIFGEKGSDYRDTSLRVKPGEEGVVIGVQVFTRRGEEKSERAKAIEEEEIQKLYADKEEERRILERNVRERIVQLLEGKPAARFPGLKKGETITAEALAPLTLKDLEKVSTQDEETNARVGELLDAFEKTLALLEKRFEEKAQKVRESVELEPDVLQVVKVYLAVKRKLQPGDKMAGRHGNKGVISIVVPEEDMPYLADGTPVDIVLNPLGVPSRMNIGQIFETHLGWAAKELGRKIGEMLDARCKAEELRRFLMEIYEEDAAATDTIRRMRAEELRALAEKLRDGVPIASPVFDGASEEAIRRMLKLAGLPETGQTTLYDGRTGEPFERPVTVGYMYMLKLHHLVDEKIHARSTGPYSLVTQQPLGGKAQFGGQRFGEMEVWALEAYGAAHLLQEMLTVKSDDIQGRTRVYESIVRGDMSFEAGLPESFRVIQKELNALGIDVEYVSKSEEKE